MGRCKIDSNKASSYTISPLNKKYLQKFIAGEVPTADCWQTKIPAPPIKEQTPEQLAAKKHEEKRITTQQNGASNKRHSTKPKKKITIWRIFWWIFVTCMVIRLIKKLF